MASYIKPYASCTIPVQIEKLDYNSLKKISFIFSEGPNADPNNCILRTWSKGQKEDWKIKYTSNNTFEIKLGATETGKLASNSIIKTIWMDVRPVYIENISWEKEGCAPPVKPVQLKILPTLFQEIETLS